MRLKESLLVHTTSSYCHWLFALRCAGALEPLVVGGGSPVFGLVSDLFNLALEMFLKVPLGNRCREDRFIFIIIHLTMKLLNGRYLQTEVEIIRPLSMDDLFLSLWRKFRVREHRRQRCWRVLTHFLGSDSGIAYNQEWIFLLQAFSSNFQQYSAKSISLMFESRARLGDESLFFGGFPMIEMEDDAAARWLSEPSKCTLFDLAARSFKLQKMIRGISNKTSSK